MEEISRQQDQPEEQLSSAKLAELSGVLREMADQQRRDQEIRLIEAELEKQRIANAHEYSLEYLKLSLQDRDSHRQAEKRNALVGLCAFVVLTVLLFAFFSLALWKGKDQIVMEVVKTALALVTGGIGGYGIGRGKRSKEDDTSSPKAQ